MGNEKISNGNNTSLTLMIVGLLPVVVGLIVMISWNLGITGLESLYLPGMPIRPNAALAIMITGLGILCINYKTNTGKTAVRLSAVIVIILGAMYIGEDLFKFDFGIKNLIFFGNKINFYDPKLIATPLNAGVKFVLIGIALLLFTQKKKKRFVIEFILVFILSLSSLTVLGYLTGLDILAGLSTKPETQVAFSMAILLILISSGLLRFIFGKKERSFAIEEKIFAILTFLIVLSIAVSILSVSAFNILNQASKVVEHTSEVKAQIQNLIIHSHNIQSGARGYVVTGKDSFAEPFYKSKNLVFNDLDSLEILTSDNELQQANVKEIRKLLKKRVEISSGYYEARKNQGIDKAIALIEEGNGKSVSDSILIVASKMTDEENRLLQIRKKNEEYSITQTQIITQINFVVQLFLLVFIFYVVSRDLTGRRKAEKRLMQSADELKDIYDNAPSGYHSLDGNGVIVKINKTELNWIGYKSEEIVGKKKFIDLVTEKSRETFYRNFPVFKEKGVVQNLEFDMIKKDGSIIPVLINGKAIKDDNGNFLASRSTLMDISDKRKNEEELKRLNDSLVERERLLSAANKELESFSYSVSHDLRAPLRHINGFIDLLRTKSSANLDDKGKRYLNIIYESATQMGQLIDDLLSFSRIGRSVVDKSELSFNNMISEILNYHKDEIEKRKIKIKIEKLPVVEADANLMRQVWMNLVGNAIKYTMNQEKPVIEIGSEFKDGSCTFFVKDNGAGFDMTYYDKLFGVFQRLHSQEMFEGTGIGLANVKRIVSKHGGKVWAFGKENEGAIFYFSLPLFTIEKKNAN